VPFTTRMTVLRLSNGDLFLHSPIKYGPLRVDSIVTLIARRIVTFGAIPRGTHRIGGIPKKPSRIMRKTFSCRPRVVRICRPPNSFSLQSRPRRDCIVRGRGLVVAFE
jgi:hypothetical protein